MLLKLKDNIISMHAGLFISTGKGTHPTRKIGSHEIIFVKSGVLDMFEEDVEFTLKAGEFLHLESGKLHGGTKDYPKDLSFYWIHFKYRKSNTKRSESTIDLPKCGRLRRPDHTEQLFRRYLDDQKSANLTPLQAGLVMSLILTEAADPRPSGNEEDERGIALAGRADLFIHANAFRDITATNVADAMKCNADYLGRVYRKAYGLTITDAIHTQRIHEARHLLLNSIDNIDEIARKCGFHDTGYFRRIFKRHMGTTPNRYRHTYARVHCNTC